MRKVALVLGGSAAVLWLSACAIRTTRMGAVGPMGAASAANASVQTNAVVPGISQTSESTHAQECQLLNRSKLPPDAYQAIDRWINFFETAGHSRMERYLARSPLYLKKMKAILRAHGVPADMVYVAMIESGFSLSARSRARAVGYWQFVAGTGRRYGLRITGMEDQRRDPIRSTIAAAKYLRGLYLMFGSWELALAAYNVGENRIQHIILSTYTRDYWEMAQRRMLPDETLNYVPKFVAAALIAQNPAKYGFGDVDYADPLQYEEVKSEHPVNLLRLARSLDMSYSDLKQYNPAYRGDYAPLGRDHEVSIRIPLAKKSIAVAALDSSAVNGHFAVRLDNLNRDFVYYRIRHGDSLWQVARRYGVSAIYLARLNRLYPRSILRIGQLIRVPGEGRMHHVWHVARYRHPVRHHPVARFVAGNRVHIVRRGETLINIARHYGVRLSRLVRVNQLSVRSTLYVGAKLLIPD